MLDLQPTLIGKLIKLRPLAPEDFEELFNVAADPLVWAQHPDPDRGTRNGFSQLFDIALRSSGCVVAIDIAHESIIGWSRYSNYVPSERVTIGWTFLARSYWGGSVNAEMKRLMLQHAFMDVSQVLFAIAERNLRSRRAVEKLGAVLVGTEEAPRWGQKHVIYGLTPELWKKRAAPQYGP